MAITSRAAAAMLALLISGTDPTECDQLVVSGSVTVSGGAILELPLVTNSRRARETR